MSTSQPVKPSVQDWMNFTSDHQSNALYAIATQFERIANVLEDLQKRIAADDARMEANRRR